MARQAESPQGQTRLDWTTVRNHLFAGLQLDPEWVSEGTDWLSWQSHAYPTTVEVTARGELGDGSGDEWMRVTAWTPLMEIDEERGSVIAARFSLDYPLGSFIWDDGTVLATSSIAFNNRSATLCPCWMPRCSPKRRASTKRLHGCSPRQPPNPSSSSKRLSPHLPLATLSWVSDGFPTSCLRCSGVRSNPSRHR